MNQMYSSYIRQKIDHNYTDNTFEMKYDCYFNVMSVDRVTSKAAYGSVYKGILENLFRHHVNFAWKLWYKE